MNADEFQGGARYVGGKVEKAIGDTVESRDWQVDGVVDQVAGGAQHAFGRAKSVIGDVIDSVPELADEARDRLRVAGQRTVDSVRETPAYWVIAAVVVGYGLAWLVHARRS